MSWFKKLLRLFLRKPAVQFCWCTHPVDEHDMFGCLDFDCACMTGKRYANE